MHYTSWGKRENLDGETRIPLLIEGGPEELGVFTETYPDGTAVVDGQVWQLHFDQTEGARATLPDGVVYRAAANFNRDKEITVSLGGKTFYLVNEASSNWIIDDADRNKVGQFSGGNNGVRVSILEFEPDVALTNNERVALSWLVRLVLESRLGVSSKSLLWTLGFFTIVGLLAAVFS